MSATVARGDPLLERGRELERIGQCLRRARGGHGGALVAEGPAGIGKTALLAGARDMAEGEGLRVLRARGAELERDFAFGVVRQLVEPVLADATDEERDALLEGAPVLAARLLSFPGVHETHPPVSPDPSFAVLHGLYWLCANLAAETPVALIVDDAHWADPASLRFLAFLLARLEGLPAAVLLGARPAEAGAGEELLAALTLDPATEVLELKPLTTEGVARLVAVGLDADPDPAFAAACREVSGGTPFLVRTLVAALRDEGITPDAGSAASVHDVAGATVGRWVLLQLGRLGADADRLARAVAILERAEQSQAARLAGLEPVAAAKAAELLVRTGVLEEPPLVFSHPMLRAGVYGELSAAERAELHGRAARQLAEGPDGGDRVAEHLMVADPAGDPWVVERLSEAAQAAAASGAPECGAAYLRRALAEPPSRDAGATLLLELGLAEFSAGERGWEEHLEGAVAAAADDPGRIAVAVLLATALGLHQRLPEALDVVERVAARVDGSDVQEQLMLQGMLVACGLLDASTAPAVAERARALLELAKEQSIPRHTLAVAAYVAASANEPAEQAAELAERAVAAGPRPVPEPGEPPWFPHAIVALFWTERYGKAQALLDAASAEARATANGLVLAPVLAQRAWLALRRGDLTAAEADARALLEAAQLPTPLLHRLLATAVLVEALVERGELDEAERALEPLRAELQSTSQTAAVLRHARGRLRVAQRRFDEALADFIASGDVATRTQAPSPSYLPWRSDAALAQLALGAPDSARGLSEEELELARSFGAPRALGVALRAAGLAAGGRRAELLLREAIEVLDGPDTQLEQARSRADLGALLRRGNRRAEARELLREALDTAHRAGARPLADRAETELRATGARPRRVLLTGLQSLTASERRIAEFAAEGHTNREIAQTLFVTARTVEGHLTNVFHKLDVKARTELPTALATATPTALTPPARRRS